MFECGWGSEWVQSTSFCLPDVLLRAKLCKSSIGYIPSQIIVNNNLMKFKRVKYDTVREVSFAPEDIARLSDALQEQEAPCHIGHMIASQPDPVRLAQVRDVIETAVTGRKYEILLLRSQGKTYSEISLLLSISKSAVQHHYRRAVIQVRFALGVGQPAALLYGVSQAPL
jgi:hypothetical protein